MRALLSVYDKTGIVELAGVLDSLGWEILSSGGTADEIARAGIPVVPVAEVTGSGEMFGHRVVTLHPKVHGAILADRDNPVHRTELEEYGITPIDLVVVNLYPFSSDPSVELIDIGGPAMVRAAAKNHAHVGVVVDPADYQPVLDELRAHGSLSAGTRRRLARRAFAQTAAYDGAIVEWLDGDDPLPPTLHLSLERAGEELRYGENPHQRAARYRRLGATSWWDDVVVHSGMALSYLNLYDADAAWTLVSDLAAFGEAAVAVIKHANPCGAAVADDLATAYRLAYECDPRSAFGGIVALGGVLDEATATEMVAAAQADVVIAPGYGPGTLEALRAKRRNTRLLEAPPPVAEERQLRQISGGFLVQDAPRFVAGRDAWRVVTKQAPTEQQWRDAEFAWRVCGHVRSNSIVLARDGQAVGIGAGQQNRVEAGEIAVRKAAGRARGGACASDAFFPFADGLEAAAAAGVAVVIQPGGSVRDQEVIAAADRLDIAMVFTGERQFLH